MVRMQVLDTNGMQVTIKITYEDGSIESFDNPNTSTTHSVHIMHPDNADSTNNYTIMRQKANYAYGSYTPWYVGCT